MRKKNPTNSGPIPLWVTGHSLGSALASLIFARFMHAPDDLGSDIVLRDCYCYGTPRLGDAAFASAFEKSVVSFKDRTRGHELNFDLQITPIDRPSILWRVVVSSCLSDRKSVV